MDAAALRLADLESRRICRFCLRTCSSDSDSDGGGSSAGAGGGLTNIGSDSKLVLKIEFALTLEVGPEDGLPQRICEGCEWLLERFHMFKDQCVKAEMMLKTFAESGVPLMQYFKPVDFEEFRWKRKAWGGVDCGIQTVEEVKLEPIYEAIAQGAIKQEAEEEDWSYGEEPAMELNVDHADQTTMDEIARKFYGAEDASHSVPMQVAELVTEMDIGSPQLAAPNVDIFDDSSNDTVEFNPVQQQHVPNEKLKPVESYPNFSEAMLLLMEDSKSQDVKTRTEDNSPQSPSDVIYEGLQTTPLRESDGLPTRFVDMEPGEIVSDDEYENSSVVIVSSDNEDSPQPDKPVVKPVQLEIPPKNPPTTPAEDYRCGSCDRAFPQSQLLEAHQKAYHVRRKPTTLQKTPSSSQQHKMAIMIDNPTKRCPKCGTMVHKASYWAHIKSHSAGERALVNYEKDAGAAEVAGGSGSSSCALEDDFLWDSNV